MKQQEIAKKANTSQGYISELISTKKRPSWKIAKALAEATNTTPELWLEGSTEEIKEALATYN